MECEARHLNNALSNRGMLDLSLHKLDKLTSVNIAGVHVYEVGQPIVVRDEGVTAA